jgi:hypothetical protein
MSFYVDIVYSLIEHLFGYISSKISFSIIYKYLVMLFIFSTPFLIFTEVIVLTKKHSPHHTLLRNPCFIYRRSWYSTRKWEMTR